MRIVTNKSLIKKKKGRATRLFFVSLAVLVGGFFIANGQLLGFIPEGAIPEEIYVLIMPLVLLFGFIATLASVRMTNLWIRIPRPEKAIPDGLKGISNRAALYNYYHFPVRHILVTPQAIFPIITRFQDGKFSVKDKKWKAHKGPIGTLFTALRLDGIGDPNREAEIAKQYVRHIVEDWDDELPIQPIIVFIDPKADVTIEDPVVPVVYADSKKSPSLKEYVKSFGEEAPQFKGDGLKDFLEEWEEATV